MEHSPSQVFDAYERIGSIRGAARALDMPYSTVRRIVQSDLVRLHDIQLSRMEEMGEEWAVQERQSLLLNQVIMSLLVHMVQHVQECFETGKLTDLRDPKLTPYRLVSKTKEGDMEYEHVDTRMQPMEALQWLLSTKQLDVVGRCGFNAAKVSETFRQMAAQSIAGTKDLSHTGSSSDLTPQQMAELVGSLESQGFHLPPGLKQMTDAMMSRSA